MRPKVILNLLFFLFCCTAVQAQTGRQITGKVIDAMGELPGVSVVIKGTTNGTTTDLNGEFKLDNVKMVMFYNSHLSATNGKCQSRQSK